MSVVSYVSSSVATSLTATCTVTAPTGIADADILVAYGWDYKSPAAIPITPPAGFTQIVRELGTSNMAEYLWWKRAASESGDYAFVADSAPTAFEAHILVFRGCTPAGSPLDVYSDTIYSTSNTIVRAASMTTNRPGARVWAGCCAQTAPTLAVPAGWTQAESVISTNYRSTTGYVCDAEGVTEGATGNQDGTITGGNSSTKHALMAQLQIPPDPYVTMIPGVPVPIPLVTALGEILTCVELFNSHGAKDTVTADIAVSASSAYRTSLYLYAPTLGTATCTVTAETGHSFTIATLDAVMDDWLRCDVVAHTAVGETGLHLKFAFTDGGPAIVYATGVMVRA